jgi:hypothetical protein
MHEAAAAIVFDICEMKSGSQRRFPGRYRFGSDDSLMVDSDTCALGGRNRVSMVK